LVVTELKRFLADSEISQEKTVEGEDHEKQCGRVLDLGPMRRKPLDDEESWKFSSVSCFRASKRPEGRAPLPERGVDAASLPLLPQLSLHSNLAGYWSLLCTGWRDGHPADAHRGGTMVKINCGL
jgi:hypothetical protein